MRWHSYQPPLPCARMKALLVIERRGHGISITRGGPHRKTQRLERSVRSRSAFCRHVALFRADFLYAEGYTVLPLVESRFASKPPCPKFHRPAWSGCGGHLLPADRRFRFAVAGRRSARLRRGEIVLSAVACGAPNPVDRSVPRVWRMPRSSLGNQPFAREEGAGGYSRARRPHWLSLV